MHASEQQLWDVNSWSKIYVAHPLKTHKNHTLWKFFLGTSFCWASHICSTTFPQPLDPPTESPLPWVWPDFGILRSPPTCGTPEKQVEIEGEENWKEHCLSDSVVIARYFHKFLPDSVVVLSFRALNHVSCSAISYLCILLCLVLCISGLSEK